MWVLSFLNDFASFYKINSNAERRKALVYGIEPKTNVEKTDGQMVKGRAGDRLD